jgi:phosphate transport system substrate-binding protein
MKRLLLPWIYASICVCGTLQAQDLISVRGSSVVARGIAPAVSELEKEHGIQINFVPEINGLEIADKLGRDVFDVALYTRPMTGQERALHPEKKFHETLIGKQAVIIVVPDEVWKAGVRALTKEQLHKIYEREIKNWKEVGGEDREIVYFNREVGRGIWDLFMIFLYGDVRKAPLSKAKLLNNPEEVRMEVAFNRGSISLLEFGDLKGGLIHALGIKLEDGAVIEPTPANIASGRYELTRPLYMVTAKAPTGRVRKLIEYMTSEEGQKAVAEAGHVPLAALEGKKPDEKK